MLPPELRLALAGDVRRPRAEVLVGGAPVRVLRLTPAGAAAVDSWIAGDPVGRSAGLQTLARRLLDAGMMHPLPACCPHPQKTEVTVVVPVRDDPSGLGKTLQALVDCGVAEVVVVDDGSRPPVGAPQHAGPGAPRRLSARIVRRSEPGGPAAARNEGWRLAQTALIAFVDADCAPAEGWLDRLLPQFADPAVAAVAPRVVASARPGTPRWLAAYERRRSPLDLGPRQGPVRPGGQVPYVPGTSIIVRRTALEAVDGFDESFRYGEDVDLVWRLHDAGWTVRYEPMATVSHPARLSGSGWLSQRYHYGESAAPLAAGHGRDVAPVAVSPWSAAAWGFAAAGHPVAAVLLAVVTSLALARRAGRDAPTARTLAALALGGNARAGGALANAVRRAWLPPALAAVALTRNGPARRVLAGSLGAALIVAPVAEWLSDSRELALPAWVVVRLADDLAYQAGVWAGVCRARSGRALLPRW